MKKSHLIGILILSIFLLKCGKKEGPEGKKSLIDLISESAGTNCPAGGYKIVSGIDMNNNNILESTEIQTTKYICNGINGNNSLAALVPEPAGPNCATGGYKINTGIDINNNNVLDANEIQNTQFVCNGLTGSNSLVALVAEPAGTHCANGGYKVNTGTDKNKNGILDTDEVQNTTYICNGNNGLNYLIAVKTEPAGPNCVYGGYNFNTGIDINKNGILDDSEITATEYICNNAPLNEVRIPLDFSGSTTSVEGVSGLAVVNFNKNNYTGLDSVVFTAKLFSGSTNSHTIADLINLTDNVVWDDSRLTSNLPLEQANYAISKNLYKMIPAKTINIGLRIRSEKEGVYSSFYGSTYLILYPKK
ncbi:DUF7151 family protein [Mucilaginibacter sp. SP1R1]|uniref:DUF7151 family protein n=1 Tax=Mucilaginibacter sp. SP1R1 TaxID=2723091 RepID=UPI00160B450F|nr:hypothetical protein [Mucilaginibacter sp. SP1R1]MBB6150595.1 hypothetical protein [Mucilaginibacter sp. SP1R1]